MTREQELLDLIAAAPDDDAHRAVYADLLSQRGEPWGELIAIQLKKAQVGLTRAEEEQERALLAAHRARWLAPIAPVLKSVQMRRGFLTACGVRFFDREQMEELAACSLWATVERLADQPHFAAIGALPNLRALGPSLLHELAELEKPLPAIRELLVEVESLDAEGCRLVSAERFPGLRSLGILGPGGFETYEATDLLIPWDIAPLFERRPLERLAIRSLRALAVHQLRDQPVRPDLEAWLAAADAQPSLKELALEPTHGIRYRFFRERDSLWSLEIQWRSEFASADPEELVAVLRPLADDLLHRIVVRQIGLELPHHRMVISRLLSRFPRLVFASAA